MITDEQIKLILDLTSHQLEGDKNQREGMDIFLGTDEELIAKVRKILNADQIVTDSAAVLADTDRIITEGARAGVGKQ